MPRCKASKKLFPSTMGFVFSAIAPLTHQTCPHAVVLLLFAQCRRKGISDRHLGLSEGQNLCLGSGSQNREHGHLFRWRCHNSKCFKNTRQLFRLLCVFGWRAWNRKRITHTQLHSYSRTNLDFMLFVFGFNYLYHFILFKFSFFFFFPFFFLFLSFPFFLLSLFFSFKFHFIFHFFISIHF